MACQYVNKTADPLDVMAEQFDHLMEHREFVLFDLESPAGEGHVYHNIPMGEDCGRFRALRDLLMSAFVAKPIARVVESDGA